MKTLWTFIENQNWHAETKYLAVFAVLGSICALLGFSSWLLIRQFAFSSPDWMICFIGYPVVFSWLVIFFYSCSHDLHQRKL